MIKMNAFGYVSAGPQRNGDNNTETLQSTADLDLQKKLQPKNEVD